MRTYYIIMYLPARTILLQTYTYTINDKSTIVVCVSRQAVSSGESGPTHGRLSCRKYILIYIYTHTRNDPFDP